MPDHLAEFSSKELPPKVSVIVADRVETALSPAIERVRAFHREGLLTSPGAMVSRDEALQGAVAPGQSMSVRWGTEGQEKIESVTLLAFDGLPIVEVVARYDEDDAVAKASVLALVRSLRCSKK